MVISDQEVSVQSYLVAGPFLSWPGLVGVSSQPQLDLCKPPLLLCLHTVGGCMDGILWKGWKALQTDECSPVLTASISWKAYSLLTFGMTGPWSRQNLRGPRCSLRGRGASSREAGRGCVFNRAEDNITKFNSIIRTQCSSPAEIWPPCTSFVFPGRPGMVYVRKGYFLCFPIYICCCSSIFLVCRHLYEDKLCQASKV